MTKDNYFDFMQKYDHSKACCDIFSILMKDYRIIVYEDDGRMMGLWTCQDPETMDSEPEIYPLNFCPNCGSKVQWSEKIK